MIKATIILGQDAVMRYRETGKLPSEKWLMDNGGVVDEKEFHTQVEYNAYSEALSDSDGWSDYEIIRQSETPRFICPVCGGNDVTCDARINPNTGEILNIFDNRNGTCKKCEAVTLIPPERNTATPAKYENNTDTDAANYIWMRLGITVTGSKEDIEKILQGDEAALASLLKKKKFNIDGETYIPSSCIEEYNSQNKTSFEEEDIEFHSLNV